MRGTIGSPGLLAAVLLSLPGTSLHAQGHFSIEGGPGVRIDSRLHGGSSARVSPVRFGITYGQLPSRGTVGWQAGLSVVPGLRDLGTTRYTANGSCAAAPGGPCDDLVNNPVTSSVYAASTLEALIRPSTVSSVEFGAGTIVTLGAGPRGHAGIGAGLSTQASVQVLGRARLGARAAWLAVGTAPVRFLLAPTLSIGLGRR